LTGHEEKVRAVAFSPDGRRLASGSDDGTVNVWYAATGREILRLAGPGGGIQSVAFSPDNRLVAAGTADGPIRLWDAATGAERHALRGHVLPVAALAFRRDGRRLASACESPSRRRRHVQERELKVWDPATGRELLTIPGGEGGVVFTPDGA